MFDRRQKINLACALTCFAMLGYAIYAEKVLGYVPCPLCMFQRVCIGTLGIVFLVAGLHRARLIGAPWAARRHAAGAGRSPVCGCRACLRWPHVH